MGVTFVHINDAFSEDLESLSEIANMTKEKGLRNKNEFWENLILNYIASLYQNFTLQEKQFLRTNDEKTIKEVIRKKLESDNTFTEEHLLTVDLEPQNKHSQLLGFYDIKIRSSLWNNYFSFECKCVNNNQSSIFEYVYNPNKVKQRRKFEDGGLYRFLINKYSEDKQFGGMIGFLQRGDLNQVKNLIYTQIKNLKLICNATCFGTLSEEGILEEEEIPYYFQTNHSRFDISENRECEPIKIHHFLYDFTE
jgi:hypothetical protein